MSGELAAVPAWATVFTSMFMHGDLLHLAGKMLFLWIFGDNIEDSIGHPRFLVFYVLCGAIAALVQAGLNSNSSVPMIGASGAISGVFGAYKERNAIPASPANIENVINDQLSKSSETHSEACSTP